MTKLINLPKCRKCGGKTTLVKITADERDGYLVQCRACRTMLTNVRSNIYDAVAEANERSNK